ncbi:hypothetical protein ACSQ67_025960 [Phaseolus vulgaris]
MTNLLSDEPRSPVDDPQEDEGEEDEEGREKDNVMAEVEGTAEEMLILIDRGKLPLRNSRSCLFLLMPSQTMC